MLKKLLVASYLVVIISSPVVAEVSITENLGKLKELPLKQGVAYSLQDNKINYLSTIELAKWKGFSLEAGYAGRAENTGDKAVAVISYQVAKAKDLGITLPILDLLECNIGAYAGLGRIQVNDGFDNGNNEFDWGVSATLVSLKF